MKYSPRFTYSNDIVRYLLEIEKARGVVDVLPLPPDVDLRLRQQARVRSTHHSTRIEGNKIAETAVVHVVTMPDRQTTQEQEVRNYWRALEWMERQLDDELSVTEDLIRELHQIIIPAPGRKTRSEYRRQPIGIVNSATGEYEYMAPDWEDVPELMGGLVRWVESKEASALPGPIRAAVLAYRFVTIHPFVDGNGRAARALATLELWRSNYWMRGFLSMEEYYTRDQEAYYASLQMGLPADYYKGRNDPDLTRWLSYFVRIMALASQGVRQSAETFYGQRHPERPPWESLTRLQQQLLSRCLMLVLDGRDSQQFEPGEVAKWFGVSPRTAREWLAQWHRERFIVSASGERRVRKWRLADAFAKVVADAAKATSTPASPE